MKSINHRKYKREGHGKKVNEKVEAVTNAVSLCPPDQKNIKSSSKDSTVNTTMSSSRHTPCRWANRPNEWNLPLASGIGHASRVSELLVANADPNEQQGGNTALICAAVEGHLNVVELLLACETIDVNVVGCKGRVAGKTALLLAAMTGNAKLAKILLTNANTDTSIKFQGKTALDWAIERGYNAVVKQLQQRLKQ